MRWTVAGLAVVGLTYGGWKLRQSRSSGNFENELRLARAEGLPTHPAEFAAQIRPATPDENAAPIYRALSSQLRYSPELGELLDRVTFSKDEEGLAAARRLLSEKAGALEAIDRAVQKPRCFFDRDWSKGAAVLFPEFAPMKAAARLLLLRGSVAIRERRIDDGLAEIPRCRRLASHASDEPHAISRLVGEAIERMANRALAGWSFANRDVAQFANELERGTKEMPRPDLKAEFSGELCNVLSLIDLSQTEEGRKELGVKPEDLTPLDNLFPRLLDQNEARVKIVRAMRDHWAALDLPKSERIAKCQAADQELFRALLAFPVAGRIYTMLSAGGDEPPPDRMDLWEKSQLVETALYRALKGPEIVKMIRTDDLRSPFDGKPLTYAFDGRQIVITVSGGRTFDDEPFRFRLPPSRLFEKGGTPAGAARPAPTTPRQRM